MPQKRRAPDEAPADRLERPMEVNEDAHRKWLSGGRDLEAISQTTPAGYEAYLVRETRPFTEADARILNALHYRSGGTQFAPRTDWGQYRTESANLRADPTDDMMGDIIRKFPATTPEAAAAHLEESLGILNYPGPGGVGEDVARFMHSMILGSHAFKDRNKRTAASIANAHLRRQGIAPMDLAEGSPAYDRFKQAIEAKDTARYGDQAANDAARLEGLRRLVETHIAMAKSG